MLTYSQNTQYRKFVRLHDELIEISTAYEQALSLPEMEAALERLLAVKQQFTRTEVFELLDLDPEAGIDSPLKIGIEVQNRVATLSRLIRTKLDVM